MKFIFEFQLNCEILKTEILQKDFFSQVFMFNQYQESSIFKHIYDIYERLNRSMIYIIFSKCEYKNVHGLM
jgi:hypothetical protein